MAVALVAVARVAGCVEAGRLGEVAAQDAPAGGVLVDEVAAGRVDVADEVAGDGVEQHAALVVGVAVVVAGTALPGVAGRV